MAIILGKDCSLTIGGTDVVGVRSVTADESVSEYEFTQYATRLTYTYPTAYHIEVQIETNDDNYPFYSYLESGAELDVNGTGFSFTGVVVSVSDSQPLDGARTLNVVMKKTFPGLRSL